MSKLEWIKKGPLVELFNKNNLDKMGPLGWVLLFAVGFLFVGLIFEIVRVLALIGGLILIIFIGGAIVFTRSKIK